MKKDWTYKLRQKLEGHQSSPPPGLWESISEQMGMAPEPVRKPILIRRWRWAAAAAILALVGFFVLYEDRSEKVEDIDVEWKMANEERNVSEEEKTEVNSEPVRPMLAKQVEKRAAVSEVVDAKDDEKKAETERKEADTQLVASADEKDSTTTERGKSSTASTEPADRPATDRLPVSLPLTRKTKEAKWSIGLKGSGRLLAAHTDTRAERVYLYYSAPSYYGSSNGTAYAPSYSYTITDHISEHYLPIRFGFSLRYQLAPRVALLSGVNYSYLYSRYGIPLYEETITQQRLHYLGVPLGVEYQLWKNPHFRVYVSGGAMLEKCLNERPWQWSVDASAGAEYTFARQWGIYVEPSVGYFFKDRTSLQHYYKKHPVTPSIEIGLRMHLNK